MKTGWQWQMRSNIYCNKNIAEKLGKNVRDHIARMMNPESLNNHEKIAITT